MQSAVFPAKGELSRGQSARESIPLRKTGKIVIPTFAKTFAFCKAARVLSPRLALALDRIEMTLAEPDVVRSDLDQFIISDVGDRLLEGETDRRRQHHCFVLPGGADVRELLALHRIDVEVVVAGMFADDHAAVDLLASADEEPAPILEVEDRIGHSHAVLHGHE